MAIGFPARFTESRTFHLGQDELMSTVKSAFESLGWSYQVLPGDEFISSLHNSPFTFGEEFRVKILANGVLEVESKCIRGGMYRMPQIFDFGANRKNVEAFLAEIQRTQDTRSSSGNS